MGFINALLITLAVESVIIGWLLQGKFPMRAVFLAACTASAITLPLVWFAFPMIGVGLFFSEVFAIAAEAMFYHTVLRGVSWATAFYVSLIANAASFIVGIIIMTFTTGII